MPSEVAPANLEVAFFLHPLMVGMGLEDGTIKVGSYNYFRSGSLHTVVPSF